MDLAREPDFELGALKVRPSVRQVEFGGRSETLEPRILQVLVALSRRPGEVVSRDELIETCWAGVTVGEDSLNRCIYRLRKLGEASQAFDVETIPKVGYRLRAERSGQPAGASAAEPPVDDGVKRRTARLPAWALVAAAVGAAAILLVVLLRPPAPSPAAPLSQRVAFFGFTAADDDPQSARIAADATDATFAEFTHMRVDAAAKADTLSSSTTDRLTRAQALGAAYALSGEVRVESGEARFAIRLEDVASRATLWESGETSPIGRRFYSPPQQAAFRAAGNTACVVSLRAELSRDSAEALQAIASYCARPFGALSSTDSDRGLVAARSLARLDPHSTFVQVSLASQLVFSASYLPPDARAERLGEADALLAGTLRTAPGDAFAIGTIEFARSIRGASPVESEQLLATAQPGGSVWGGGFLLYRRGLNLLSNGRTAEGVARLKESAAAQATLTQVSAFQAYGLASQGKAADAELLFEQIFPNEPGAVLVWPMWVRAAVLEGVGDADAVIAAAAPSEPRASIQCWRSVLDARRAARPGPSAASLRECGSAAFILAALGRMDDAFDAFRDSPRQRAEARMFFAPSARAMRAHPRFLPLMRELGLWDYWVATNSHPDVCELPEERDFEICVKLRDAQGT